MTAAVIVTVASLSVAGMIAVLALRLIHTEREAFDLERIGWREERMALVAEHRSDTRELLNRVQHPQLVPTATRPSVSPRPVNAGERARAAWASVGRVAPPAPTPPDEEIGDDVP